MKLVWKGFYKNEKQLDVGNLPEDAVAYKEPKNLFMLNVVSSIFIIPVIIFVFIMTEEFTIVMCLLSFSFPFVFDFV